MSKRAALLFVTLIACNKKVDTEDFAKTVAANLAAAGFPGAAVTCPKDVAAKQGATFTCTVKFGETSYQYDVEITAVNGSKLDTTGSFEEGVPIVRDKLVGLLVPAIKEKIGKEPILDCGQLPILFSDDGKLYCDITADGQTGKLRVDVDGDQLKGWEIEAE